MINQVSFITKRYCANPTVVHYHPHHPVFTCLLLNLFECTYFNVAVMMCLWWRFCVHRATSVWSVRSGCTRWRNCWAIAARTTRPASAVYTANERSRKSHHAFCTCTYKYVPPYMYIQGDVLDKLGLGWQKQSWRKAMNVGITIVWSAHLPVNHSVILWRNKTCRLIVNYQFVVIIFFIEVLSGKVVI